MPTVHRVKLNGVLEPRRSGTFFSQLSPKTLEDFRMLERISIYEPDILLFLEKQTPQGLFVLCEGRIKLSISSRNGKKLILRIAEPGELLDITAALSGTSFETTAETLQTCRVGFVSREAFLSFVLEHPDAQQSLTRELSLNYQRACEKLRAITLCTSVSERLARLLLEWSNTGQETECGKRVTVAMTHEEIGEFIGTTRETVTRTLSDFKHRKMVSLHGSSLTISDRVALEGFARA